MSEPVVGGYQYNLVTCKDCGHVYRCSPSHDYYNATNDRDGVCFQCLMKKHGLPNQPEPSRPMVDLYPASDEPVDYGS